MCYYQGYAYESYFIVLLKIITLGPSLKKGIYQFKILIYLGLTSLMIAAYRQKDLVETLLQHGADVNAEDNEGK